MDGSRSNSLTPVVVAAFLVEFVLLAYVGGYFWLGTPIHPATGLPMVARSFKTKSLCIFFLPAGEVESAIRGSRVSSLLKNSTGCAIARMRCQNDDEIGIL